MKSKLTLALAGHPNSGKSTLFNALTGGKQHVGNWPGVTVSKKTGSFSASNQQIDLIDLPGLYAIDEVNGMSSSLSEDEQIANRFLQEKKIAGVINILDAAHPERGLYLTLQLLEQGIPVVVIANRMDILKKSGFNLNCSLLSKILNCPVIPWIATCEAVDPLKEKLAKLFSKTTIVKPLVIPQVQASEDADILKAEARYQFIQKILEKTFHKISEDRRLTQKIDQVILNRYLGLPIFLLVLYGLFFFTLGIGGLFQNFFDILGGAVFVGGFAKVLSVLGVPPSFIAICAEGIGRGLQTTFTFIPVLACLFFFLSLLEDSGYMARAAFVIDRLMRFLGLPGKALVPIIVGFGCNVPAIMAARTLENKRDRVLTVMMMPFVPCGARLAIFTVFVAAFFKTQATNIIFALYLIGVSFAIFMGFLMRKTVLAGAPSPLLIDMPEWLMPRFKTLLIHTWQRLSGFVVRAGRLIIPISLLISVLNTIQDAEGRTLLAHLGQSLTPFFAPMGLDENNWPATVGLITGVLAKEVVIGTLNTLYSQSAHLAVAVSSFQFWGEVKSAFASIFDNFSGLSGFFKNPIVASAPLQSLPESVYGVMVERFHSTLAAFSYLIFVLLYFPCVSTLAAMWREIGGRWTIFSMVSSVVFAYLAAIFVYQCGQFSHPFWFGTLGLGILLILISLFRRSKVAYESFRN